MFDGFKEFHSTITCLGVMIVRKGIPSFFLSLSYCILEYFFIAASCFVTFLSCFEIKPYVLILYGRCFQTQRTNDITLLDSGQSNARPVMVGMCSNYINKIEGSTVKGRSATLSDHKTLPLFF